MPLSQLFAAAVLSLFTGAETLAQGDELRVGAVCPVSYQNQNIGILVFSKEWYHTNRTQAAYIAADNATGIGIEIHLFANQLGHLSQKNIAACDHYRLIQVRSTTARLAPGEERVEVDIPDDHPQPFYDIKPLEHGYGVHQTPKDSSDKPWPQPQVRASTVAIYDTPFVTSYWGIEGQPIQVEFETCVTCQRTQGFDSILSCGRWGFEREFIADMSGWAEPEFSGVECLSHASERFLQALDQSSEIDYSFWLNWRPE